VSKDRLDAFTDGVLAIIITIMVLELKVPHSVGLAALAPLVPIFLVYALSFLMVAIYWNNHHHLLHAVDHVTGGTLWANMHLLFWLSLFPFVMGWMGENHYAPVPVAAFGVVLLLAAIAYFIFTRVLLASHGPESLLARAVATNAGKMKVSMALYAAAIPLAFVHPALALAIYVGVALWWLVPERRIERMVVAHEHEHPAR